MLRAIASGGIEDGMRQSFKRCRVNVPLKCPLSIGDLDPIENKVPCTHESTSTTGSLRIQPFFVAKVTVVTNTQSNSPHLYCASEVGTS